MRTPWRTTTPPSFVRVVLSKVNLPMSEKLLCTTISEAQLFHQSRPIQLYVTDNLSIKTQNFKNPVSIYSTPNKITAQVKSSFFNMDNSINISTTTTRTRNLSNIWFEKNPLFMHGINLRSAVANIINYRLDECKCISQ